MREVLTLFCHHYERNASSFLSYAKIDANASSSTDLEGQGLGVLGIWDLYVES